MGRGGRKSPFSPALSLTSGNGQESGGKDRAFKQREKESEKSGL